MWDDKNFLIYLYMSSEKRKWLPLFIKVWIK